MTQTQRKALPDRTALWTRAAALLEQPDGFIVFGPLPEDDGYTASKLQALFQKALLEFELP